MRSNTFSAILTDPLLIFQFLSRQTICVVFLIISCQLINRWIQSSSSRDQIGWPIKLNETNLFHHLTTLLNRFIAVKLGWMSDRSTIWVDCALLATGADANRTQSIPPPPSSGHPITVQKSVNQNGNGNF